MKSDQNLRIVTIILAIIGLVDSIYLTAIKMTNTAVYCLPGLGDCETVNTSRYSEIFGVPIALLGAFAYAMILIICYLENKNAFFAANGSLLLFGISLVGVLYSTYLTYVEIAVIHAICPYCVISAVVLLGIFVISTIRLLRTQGSQNS
jgi:uncharacterized membrane protein